MVLWLSPLAAAQDFKIFDRTVQVHGFASQGYVYTAGNNWLTMHSDGDGSPGYTDFGLNMSVPLTDRLRVGAQVYDRNLGQLGQYHPSLDWAVADFRLKSWLGIRAGKVKTTIGLFNDTEDQDFLRVFALLPQSVYPTDLRESTIAHVGGDVYGAVSPLHRLGEFFYTAYTGHRDDGKYSGSTFLTVQYGIRGASFKSWQAGADLRWQTPVKGLLVGASRLNEISTDKGTVSNPLEMGQYVGYRADSKSDWQNQFYGEYVRGKLRIDSEFYHTRLQLDDKVEGVLAAVTDSDVISWYASGTYRLAKRLAVGSYYSHFTIKSLGSGPLAILFPSGTDTSLPANHVYDKVISGRIDLTKFWNVKLEGHFIDGYGSGLSTDGFYPQVNPGGFKHTTNALVIRTSVYF